MIYQLPKNGLVLASLLSIMYLSCNGQSKDTTILEEMAKPAEHVVEKKPISSVGDIPAPNGYVRLEVDSNHIGNYFRELSLKSDNTVYLFNGQTKGNQQAQYRVLDIDIGTRNLQQCADAVMRLRADYLYSAGRHSEIGFHFTNGDYAAWDKYARGYRGRIVNNHLQWNLIAKPDSSYPTFRKYLNLVYSYAGTASMDKEVLPSPYSDIQPGDVFHQTGRPYGHAVTVLDVVVDSSGNRKFMLAQSYMPAQSIHILRNPNSNQNTCWYNWDETQDLVTPEWIFPAGSLKRWK